MNQKLELLIIQSGGIQKDGAIVFVNSSLEKFVELIVRHAAHISAEHVSQCSGVTYGVETVVLNEFEVKNF